MGKRRRLLLGVTVLIILIAVLAGCGGNQKAAQRATSAPASYGDKAEYIKEGSAQDRGGSVGGVALAAEIVGFHDRKVIKNAEVNLEVTDLVETTRRLEIRVESLGGLVADGSLSGYEKGHGNANMTLRVPADKFGILLAEILEMGKVLSKRTYTDDVTKNYLDLEARVTNLKRQEERLLQILAQAKTVEDILKVEREIERVRGQIEANTGELNFLKDRVQYSTINLSLRAVPEEQVKVQAKDLEGVWQRSLKALVGSINGLLSFGGTLVVFLFGFFPIAVVLAVVGALAWRVQRWYSRRQLGKGA